MVSFIGIRNAHQKKVAKGLEENLVAENERHNKEIQADWNMEALHSNTTTQFLKSHLGRLDDLTEKVSDRIRNYERCTSLNVKSPYCLTYTKGNGRDKIQKQSPLEEHLTSLGNLISRIQNKLK